MIMLHIVGDVACNTFLPYKELSVKMLALLAFSINTTQLKM